jgi:hypothetical protein
MLTIGRRAYETGMLRQFAVALPAVAAGVMKWYAGLRAGSRRAANGFVARG